MNFAPVRTLEELDGLDMGAILEGYRSAERGDPEPGENRGKAFWHGWCNRQRDFSVLPYSGDAAVLAGAYVKRERQRREDSAS